MRLLLTGRGVDLSPALRQTIESKLSKLERVLNDSVVSAHVVLAQERYRRLVEIVVHARGDHTLHGEGDATTWPLAIKQAVDKIGQQAQTLKHKWEARKRRRPGSKALPVPQAVPSPPAAASKMAPRRAAAAAPSGRRIIRAARYAVSAMSLEDAASKVEASDETFVVFRNDVTDSVSIMYRRKDGNFGLIEPEA